MSLQVANTYNAFNWSQVQINEGFTSTYQSDSFQYSKNYTVNLYNINSVYAVQVDIAPSANLTIDLQNLTDFFNNPLLLTRAYGIQIGVLGADILIGPAAINGFQWFFNSLSDGIVVKADSDFMYNTSSMFTVNTGASVVQLTNLSVTETAVVKLAILGGEGPSTTPTPTPTMSPSPTVNPTATPSPSGTPVPTPSIPTPTYFVTPSPT